jgi:hypothetical protein
MSAKVLLVGIAFVATIPVGWAACAIWTAERELHSHLRIITAVDAQLGFHYGTPYEKGEEVFVITDVVAGGIMDESGLRVGDYPQCSIASLYERIVFGQGKRVALPVERGGKVLTLEIVVPTLKLPHNPAELHWYFTKHSE